MSKPVWRLLIIGLPVALVAAYLLQPPQILPTTVASKRSQCKNNLKQIGLGLHLYHETHKSFPPAFVVGPDGKRWHSWRVLLLPFMECPELVKKYRFDESWDGPNNRQLWNQCPEFYRCPSNNPQMPASNYLAVIGPQTVWPETAAAIQLADIKDELSKTITVIEVPYGVPWLSPVDITDEDAATLWVDITAMPPSHHNEGRNVLMADGRVRFLSPKLISRETWAALFMRQGGETISELELGDQTRRK